MWQKYAWTVICLIGGMHLCRTEENRYSATLRSVLGGIEFILLQVEYKPAKFIAPTNWINNRTESLPGISVLIFSGSSN